MFKIERGLQRRASMEREKGWKEKEISKGKD